MKTIKIQISQRKYIVWSELLNFIKFYSTYMYWIYRRTMKALISWSGPSLSAYDRKTRFRTERPIWSFWAIKWKLIYYTIRKYDFRIANAELNLHIHVYSSPFSSAVLKCIVDWLRLQWINIHSYNSVWYIHLNKTNIISRL